MSASRLAKAFLRVGGAKIKKISQMCKKYTINAEKYQIMNR